MDEKKFCFKFADLDDGVKVEPLNSYEKVLAHLTDDTSRPGKIRPCLKIDDQTLHVGTYIGMGNSELTTLDKFNSVIERTIRELYDTEQLVAVGEEFNLYPGGAFFRELKIKVAG